jgi:hypothetical protein
MTLGRYCVGITLLFFLCAGSRPVFADQQELLETVQAGHQASLDAIRTFFCRISLTREPKSPFGITTGKCWRMGEKVRSQSRTQTSTSDVLVVGSRQTSITRGPSPRRGSETSGAIANAGGPLECDPWSDGLFTFFGQKRFRVTFSQLLSEPHRLHSVKNVKIDGRDLVYVSLSHDRARFEWWFDPQVNYLVRKMAGELNAREAAGQKTEHVVSKFREAAPGIFFPERVERRFYKDGKQISLSIAAFTEIQVNPSLPQGIFELRFPPGIMVADQIQGKMFKTDDLGRAILPALDPKTGKPLTLGTGEMVPGAEGEDGSNRVTEEEPRPWTRWLFPMSLGTLAVAGVLFVITKWRQPRPLA